MARLTKITLPNGNTYDLQDLRVDSLVGVNAVTFGGVTDTSLADGATTTAIHKKGAAAGTTVTPTAGEI